MTLRTSPFDIVESTKETARDSRAHSLAKCRGPKRPVNTQSRTRSLLVTLPASIAQNGGSVVLDLAYTWKPV